MVDGRITYQTNLAGTVGQVNPFRYRSYYYDNESGFYYLQSRYYDAGVRRFINADELLFLGANGSVLGYNLYVYCENDPINNEDSTGFAYETVIDVISVIWSFIDLIKNPCTSTAGFFIWDAVSVVVPFLPGSYAYKGAKLTLSAPSKLSELTKNSKYITGTYKQLKKLFKKLKNVEIHHLVEKRFSVLFKVKVDDYLSIPLGKAVHRVITNRWRKEIPYGTDYRKISYAKMKNINERNYGDLSEAVAFVINFAFMVYTYGDVDMDDLKMELCSKCGKSIQNKDFLAPKTSCKKEYGILHNLHYGVDENIKNELVDNFDITENDFRPVRNKTGDIVYYQITPQNVMLPIQSVNRIRSLKPCKKCGSVQYRIKEYDYLIEKYPRMIFEPMFLKEG